MRWAFWRKDEAEPPASRPLPSDTGLPSDTTWAGSPVRDDTEPDNRAMVRGSRARPSTEPPPLVDTGSASQPHSGRDGMSVDAGRLAFWRDGMATLARAAAARNPAAVRDAVVPLQTRLTAASDDEQGLAVLVSLAVLSERLPDLAGLTASAAQDEASRPLLLSYADLLAERTEPLRTRVAPHLTRDQLRFAGRFACGAPDSDPSLAHLMTSPAVDQVLAACLLLAQTSADGGGDLTDLETQVDALFPAA